MSETLLGVAIGGAVGLLTALISAVIAPSITARHERRRGLAERVNQALEACEKPLDTWYEAVTDVAVRPEDPVANIPELATALKDALGRFSRVNDDALRGAVAEALEKESVGTLAAITVSYRQAKEGFVPQEGLDKVSEVAAEAELAVRDVWRRALDLADPPSLYRRARRRVASRHAPSRAEQIDTVIRRMRGTRELGKKLKGDTT